MNIFRQLLLADDLGIAPIGARLEAQLHTLQLQRSRLHSSHRDEQSLDITHKNEHFFGSSFLRMTSALRPAALVFERSSALSSSSAPVSPICKGWLE